MINSLFKLLGGFIPLTYLVLDGHFGNNNVSPQNFGVGSYSAYHDQPNGFEEDFSRIRLPREGISPVFKIRSRIYSKKLIPNLRVVSTALHKNIPGFSALLSLGRITDVTSLHHSSGS